jgi:hypothetical protein
MIRTQARPAGLLARGLDGLLARGIAGACALWMPTLAHAGGGLMVRSQPEGLRIYVDGDETGLVTPAQLLGLPAGPHRIELTGDCKGAVGEVNIEEGKVSELSLPADLVWGWLRVSPNPSTAAVAVDGVEGPPNRQLNCGSHAIRVALPGYVQSVQTVEIEAGRTVELPVSLDPLGNGSLSLVIDPPEAEVKLDGRAIGKGSVSQPTVVAGPHLLELSAPGYTPLQQSILIDAGAETRLALHLERAPGAALAATPEPKPPREGLSRSQKLKVTGWSVGAVGLGVGVFGATRFAVSGAAYDEYVQRSASGPGPQSEVEAIRDEQVVPARNLGVTLSTVGAAMLAGGLTMAVTF